MPDNPLAKLRAAGAPVNGRLGAWYARVRIVMEISSGVKVFVITELICYIEREIVERGHRGFAG